MNIDHLKIFIDLAKTRNYTKTARNVYVTQPAISQAMKTLEKELNVKLLNRERSGVALTKCGEIFLNEITDIVSQLDRTIENVRLASERYESSISVGYSGTILETKKVGELQKFLATHSDMTIYMENFSMRYLKQYLIDGQCDMVFHIRDTSISDEQFDYYQLEQGRYMVVMSKDNPLCSQKLLRFEDLINETFIMVNANQCFAEQQIVQDKIKSICNKKSFYYSDSFTLMHELIKTNLGIAILPDFLEGDNLDLRLIPLDYEVELSYGITTLHGNKNPIVQQVIKEIALQI